MYRRQFRINIIQIPLAGPAARGKLVDHVLFPRVEGESAGNTTSTRYDTIKHLDAQYMAKRGLVRE